MTQTPIAEHLTYLRQVLEDKPPRNFVVIVAARMLLAAYPRNELPDWIEILANGNPDMLDSVIEAALADIHAEEPL